MKQYSHREFVKVVKANGYHYDRHNGDHSIYINDNGRHISIPAKLESVIARRLIKENNLELDLKKLKRMDNLPAGAANDPRAPYNEEFNQEVEVLASLTVSRSLKVSMPKGYTQEDLVRETRKQLSLPELAKHMQWVEDEFEVIEE